ncbi:hypothetical protein N2152v2_004947 [Parachlorella kessleri]
MRQRAAQDVEPPRPPQASWQYVLSLLTIAEGALEVSHSLLLEEYAGREAIAAILISAPPPLPPVEGTNPQLEGELKQPLRSPAAPGSLQPVPGAATAAVDVAEVEAGNMAVMSLEELRAAVQQTRSAATALTVQLADLQSSTVARLPEGLRGEVEGVLASITRLEAELSSLWKGDEAAAALEQQRQELQWGVFSLLKPHASEDEAGGYGSLLASLCLQRQLLLALEARQCVVELETELSAQQALLAGAQQLGSAAPAAAPALPAAQPAAETVAHPAQQATQGRDLHAGDGDGEPGGGLQLTVPAAEQAAGLPASPAAEAETEQDNEQNEAAAAAALDPEQQAEQRRHLPAEQGPVEQEAVSTAADSGAAVTGEECVSTEAEAQQAFAAQRLPQGPAHVAAAEESAAQPALAEQRVGELASEAEQEESGEKQQAELQPQPSAGASQTQPPEPAAAAGAQPAQTGDAAGVSEVAVDLAAGQEPSEAGLEPAEAAVTNTQPPPSMDKPAVTLKSTQGAHLPFPPSLTPSPSSINAATPLPAPAATPADPVAVAPEEASRPVQQLRLVAAGCMIPHPDKAETGGEDAFFVSREGCGAMGVADGVGGWAAEGIDPALYPRELLAACQDGLEHHAEDPFQLLQHAHQHAHAPGSCTVCLAAMQGDGALKVVSLGDCGVAVMRPGEGVVFRGEVQEHEFNMPYQMASPRFLPMSNQPEEAQQYEVAVQPGDVVLLGSDGLFDNLWEHEMEELVQWQLQDLDRSTASSLDHAAHALAAELAQRAHQHAQDPTYRSPFAVERHERVVHPFVRSITKPLGGKLDDITCVVALLAY